MGLFDSISGFADVAGSLISGVSAYYDYENAKKDRWLQKDIAEQNLKNQKEQQEYQRRIDEYNQQQQDQQRLLQQEQWQNELSNQQYQKNLTSLQMQREDTAVQRRVADLKAAGLSPVLAAGSAAGTGAMAKIGSFSNASPQQIHSQSQAPYRQGYSRVPEITPMLLNMMGVLKMTGDITRQATENKLLKMQQGVIDSQIAQTKANTYSTYMDARLRKEQIEKEKWELKLAQESGMSTNPGGIMSIPKNIQNAAQNNPTLQGIINGLTNKIETEVYPKGAPEITEAANKARLKIEKLDPNYRGERNAKTYYERFQRIKAEGRWN